MELKGNNAKITRGKKGVKNISLDMPMKDWVIFKLLHIKSNVYSGGGFNIKDKQVKELFIFIDETISLFNTYIGVIDFDKSKPSAVIGGKLKYNLIYSLINTSDNNREEILSKINNVVNSEVFNEIILLHLNPEKAKQDSNHSKWGKHLISQMYSINTPTLFDEHLDNYLKKADIKKLDNRPDRYGIALNMQQQRVLEGIIKGFSDKNYKGDVTLVIDKDFIRQEKGVYNTAIASVYDNIKEMPIIRVTQAELIRLSGFSTSQGDKVDVINSLQYLATNQFCFYWNRLKRNDKDIPVKDRKGIYVKEEVMEVGTLLRVKVIKSDEGIFQYYEIQPSPVMLDQLETYFVMVPNNWREEVKLITGKTASSYTYMFLFWLRTEFDKIRSHNDKKNSKERPFTITKKWSDIAITLNMPETMYKRNRARAEKIIKEAYDVASKIGYLDKVDTSGGADVLFLNKNYFVKEGELT